MTEISMQHEIPLFLSWSKYLFYRVMTYPSYVPDTNVYAIHEKEQIKRDKHREDA